MKGHITMNAILAAVLTSFLAAFLIPVNGEWMVEVEPPDVTNDTEVICDAIQRADEDIQVNIEETMDYDDLLRLIVWSSKYNLRDGRKVFNFPSNVNWKRSVLAKLGSICVKICPREFVDPEFINAVTELFMIYQNSVNESLDHASEWNVVTPVLDSCHSKSQTLDMVSTGFDLTGVKVKVDGGVEEVAILPPEELADSSQDLDIIIDTVWWLFSLSVGKCYWSAENPSFWVTRYKRLFYADFLQDLKQRWLHAGTDTDFGPIFGDFSYKTIIKNIRACVTAAYTSNGIADRQLVRSLGLAAPTLGIEAGLNKKIGKPLL